MMGTFRTLLVVSTIVSCTTVAATAWAAPNDRAERLFQQARKLMSEGKVADACPLFEESYSLTPGLGVLLNVGGCYESSGRPVLAYRTYRKVEAQARSSGRKDREDEARSRAESLREKVALVAISSPKSAVASLKSGTEQLDMEAAVKTASTVTVAVDPGSHPLVAVLADGSTHEKNISATVGTTTSWTIESAAGAGAGVGAGVGAGAGVEPAPPAGIPVQGPPHAGASTAPEASTGTPPTLIGAIVAGGVGLVGVGLGTFFAVRAKGIYSDSDAHCPSGIGCDREGLSLVDSARSSGDMATVSFVAGGVALAAGVVLYLLTPRSSSSPRATGRSPFFMAF